MGAPNPVLTVDLEEWFHVCGHPLYGDPARWDGFLSRVGPSTELLLDLLARTRSRATFFVLGWIARRHPSLVARIVREGHEVGCHGDLHVRADEVSLEAFRADVRAGKAAVEDASGQAVTAFRAPEWSLRRADSPALALLVEEGFTVDSSLQAVPPIGDRGNPTRPTLLPTSAGPILEVPPLVGTFLGFPAMLGGGWTARLSRESRVRRAMAAAEASGIPAVLYVHPWEVDPDHPAMELSPIPRLVHFAGRGRVLPRLARLCEATPTVPLSAVVSGAARGTREAPGVAA